VALQCLQVGLLAGLVGLHHLQQHVRSTFWSTTVYSIQWLSIAAGVEVAENPLRTPDPGIWLKKCGTCSALCP
jgi:hypothetical protein